LQPQDILLCEATVPVLGVSGKRRNFAALFLPKQRPRGNTETPASLFHGQIPVLGRGSLVHDKGFPDYPMTIILNLEPTYVLLYIDVKENTSKAMTTYKCASINAGLITHSIGRPNYVKVSFLLVGS
jgi:hypothetical protein